MRPRVRQLTRYVKQRILYHRNQGYKSYSIAKLLKKEGICTSRKAVWRFIKHYESTGSTARKTSSGRPTKVTPAILAIVEHKMAEDDETTAVQLQKLLTEKGHPLSISTIIHARSELGWTFRGSAYCQLIRDVNKVFTVLKSSY